MGEDWSVSFLSQGFVTYESYEAYHTTNNRVCIHYYAYVICILLLQPYYYSRLEYEFDAY